MPTAFNAAAWLVDRHVEAGRGERIAVVCDDDAYTYGQLQTMVASAGAGFTDLGLRAEERVLMVVDDEPAFLVAFLGALRIGAVPVPVSTMLRSDEVAALAADCRARLVVVSDRHRVHLPAVAGAAGDSLLAAVSAGAGATVDETDLTVHPLADLGVGRAAPVAPTWDESPGFWLYTSGTTGLPKAAMHRHIDLKVTSDTYAETVLTVSPDDRCFSIAKLFFAYGLGNSLTFPLAVGGTSILSADPPTPAGVRALLAAHRPTLFFASPGFCAALLDAGAAAEEFESVRLAVTAGEALPAELYRRVSDDLGLEVLDGIGTTEALHIFCSNVVGAQRPGTSGTMVEGYEGRLVDDDGAVIDEADRPGYLEICGDSIATGYWCRSEATRAAFVGSWLRTGDVYTRSVDGYWTFLGRNSDMIKAGGIWVSPAEVENVLLQHESVLEAAVIGARDDQGLETVVAYCVARTGADIEPDVLLAHCREHMAAFKRPRAIVVVDELPKTATGKVQRFQLRNLHGRA